MVIKIDLQEAYNRLEWRFIDSVLFAWGFFAEASELLMSCINIVQYSIILNGSLIEQFKPTRGLHQGDPISLYVFILCVEVLSRMLLREEELGNLQEIKIGKGVSGISHLLYADDILVTCWADDKYASTLVRVLDTFSFWSGLKANASKSQIYFLLMTSDLIRRKVKQALGFKEFGPKTIYLGNSLILSQNKT